MHCNTLWLLVLAISSSLPYHTCALHVMQHVRRAAQAMELRLGGCNAYDLSQLMYGLGAMHDGRAKLPASLLRSVERQACSMIGSFLPQVHHHQTI